MRAALSLTMAGFIAASAMIAVQPAAAATETGMASIHSWRKVGRKTCLVDHDHSGSGSGPSRKVAEIEAIRSWVGFTDLEYGDAWANFNMAINKTMRCGGGPGGFQCDVLATACRGW